MYGLKGGAVPVPSWILILRGFQLLFAILTLAMCAYSLSVSSGGPLQPALIPTIIISCLTLVPILLATTPLLLVQRRLHDPRIALLLDGFACLFWLVVFTVLASYEHIFRGWGRGSLGDDLGFDLCQSCRRAWETGVAATVFAAIEFLLFLFTGLAFIYYYHLHLSEHPGAGPGHKECAGTTSTNAPAGSGTHTGAADAEAIAGATQSQHPSSEIRQVADIPHPHQTSYSDSPGVGTTPYNTSASRISSSHPAEMAQNSGPPYLTYEAAHQVGGGYGSNTGYANV